MSIFNIKPYIGYNNIMFNETQESVSKIDGVAQRIVIDNIMEETYEHRNASVKLTYVEGKFVDIWIPQKPADNQVSIPGYFDMNIFSDNAVEMLKGKYDYHESKDKNRILFPQLGICLWGFAKKTKEGKMVIAFSDVRLSWYKTFLQA